MLEEAQGVIYVAGLKRFNNVFMCFVSDRGVEGVYHTDRILRTSCGCLSLVEAFCDMVIDVKVGWFGASEL